MVTERPSDAIGSVRIDAARLLRPADEELRQWASSRRIFASSVMGMGLARATAIDAIEATGAEPVAWELLTPRPVAANDAWLDGVSTAEALILLIGADYGQRRADGFSATHREFLRAEELGLHRWIFLDGTVPANERDGHLRTWLAELSESYSYATFSSPETLRSAIIRTITDLARYRLYTWFKLGPLVLRADGVRLSPPSPSWSQAGEVALAGTIGDAGLRGALADIHREGRTVPLVIDGQLFDATPLTIEERATRGSPGYATTYRIAPPRLEAPMLWVTMSESGRTWQPADLVELTVRDVLGLAVGDRPQMITAREGIDWLALVGKAGRIPELFQVLAELIVGERLLRTGALTRVTRLEARLIGPPPGIALALEGVFSSGLGLRARPLSLTDRVPL